MDRINKKLIVCLFSLFFVLGSVFAQDAVTRALDLLNKNLILNDTEKAYSYSQFILNYYEDEEIPEDAMIAVKNAVIARGNYLIENEMWDAALGLEDDLKTAPKEVKQAASLSIKKAQRHFEELEAEKERQRLEKEQKKEEEKKLVEELKKKESEKAEQALKEAETKKMLELFEQQRKLEMQKEMLRDEQQKQSLQKQIDLEKNRQDAELQYRQELNQMIMDMNKNNSEAIKTVSSNNKVLMFSFFAIILIFVVVIVFVVVISYRQQKQNQQQMNNTILTMQAMRVATPIQIGLPLNLQMENLAIGEPKPEMKLLGDTHKAEDAIVVDENTDQEEIKVLLKACKQYGEQIDVATGRKNVTSHVAELVYKVSVHLGFSEAESIIYYASSLTYDIGFLSIDPVILSAETLNEKQFEIIKTHTNIGPNMVFFVDEKYRNVFKDAANKHHENLDGTGYPNGLKGEQIPYIARVIRVVESYVALISSRQYRSIKDRDTAIQELRNSPKHYDQQIVDALDAIV